MPDERVSPFNQLCQDLGRSWDAIRKAQADARDVEAAILASLEQSLGKPTSGDAEIVTFGSLARREWTSGSDVDWTLLIDGQAKAQHWQIAQAIHDTLNATEFHGKRLPNPGSTGIFGNMAFSHDIIHNIGGQDDTNRNTTQRILLLLESAPLRTPEQQQDIGAHGRVVRAVLERYLRGDTKFLAIRPDEPRVPRFLLNDIVRFWRTMCVDFAWKEWEQRGTKWALRNVKLRISRKLIFVSGLLMAFSCYENEECLGKGESAEEYIQSLQDHLVKYASLTPLEIVAKEFTRASLQSQAGRLFDVYDCFLRELDDETVRKTLGGLRPDEAHRDETFQRLHDLSHQFQAVLTEAFFDAETPLRAFNRHYGVF